MPKLIRLIDGAFVAADDRFTNLADDEPLPEGDVIISLTRFQAEGEALFADGARRWRARRAGEVVDALGL